MTNPIHSTCIVKGLNDRIQGKGKLSAIPSHAIRMPEDKVSLQEKPVEVITYGILQKAAFMASDYISLRKMIVNLLEGQGTATRIAVGDTSIDFRDLTPGKAQDLISGDGYWGVEQTSDRIVQFAISLGGNDPKRLEKIKAGIDKGFQMAAKALGGTLPDISMKTYEVVMDKLDVWVQGK